MSQTGLLTVGGGLFSIGITVYNNAEYLYEALDSVLKQTYPNIEIIVSDDGTRGFDCSVYEDYIETHKGKNIKKYAVYTQTKNAGTVKNCNFTVKHMQGEYYMFLAADDALYDNYVLEKFAQEFEKRGDSCSILSGAVAMCTNDIQEITEYAPDSGTRRFIENCTPQEMFRRLAAAYTVPAAGTCYRMKLYKELGGYDEDYELIEDGPFYARAARAGYRFGWVEDFAAARHRDGGISHGNARNHALALRRYYKDEALFFEKEVRPYQYLLEDAQYRLAVEKQEHAENQYWLLSQESLFTIGITVYNNAQYLRDVLDSIFCQTYPKVEIIISDDGSKDFDQKEWEDYIKTHKGSNICSYKVFGQKENTGTVKNVNFILEQAAGNYFMFVAADDALYDAGVLAGYAREFERRGDSCKILSASVAMCTEDIREIVSIEPDDAAVRAIREHTPQQMFARLAHTYTIPAAGTAYRKVLFEEIGRYDEAYRLIEDGPFFIRMARMGYSFGWIDKMTAARHRDGGISHGNKRNHTKAYQTYTEDEILFFEKEVIPYRMQINDRQYRLAMEKYEYAAARYYLQYIRKECSMQERMHYLKKHGGKGILKRIARESLYPVYESLQLIYANLLRAGAVLCVLHVLGKEIGQADGVQKKKMLPARTGSLLLAGWMVLNACSTCRYLIRIWRTWGNSNDQCE